MKTVTAILLGSFCLPAIAADMFVFITGAAFKARSSTQVITYKSGGCIYSNKSITTDLQLPQGATIKGVRLFYTSYAASQKVTMYLTEYDGIGGKNDLLKGVSSQYGGFNEQYFSMGTPVVVDNEEQSYSLIASMDSAFSYLCGMRVSYEVL